MNSCQKPYYSLIWNLNRERLVSAIYARLVGCYSSFNLAAFPIDPYMFANPAREPVDAVTTLHSILLHDDLQDFMGSFSVYLCYNGSGWEHYTLLLPFYSQS